MNVSCPQDLYLLPKIDRMCDMTSSYKTLRFMDVYSGYKRKKYNHQREEELYRWIYTKLNEPPKSGGHQNVMVLQTFPTINIKADHLGLLME